MTINKYVKVEEKRADYPCEACHRELASHHVTVEVTVFNGHKRTKVAQFWLCPNCERKNRILLAQDETQRERVARAMTPMPSWWKEEE